MKIRHQMSRIGTMLIISSVLVGCAQLTNTPQNPQPDSAGTTNQGIQRSNQESAIVSQIPDLPIPPGSVMNIERTFMVGSAGSWYGQTMIESPGDGNMSFDFFKQQLPTFGWQELSSVRARTSVLTYTREQRVLAIQLTENRPGTTEVMITVSPRGGNASDLLQPVQ